MNRDGRWPSKVLETVCRKEVLHDQGVGQSRTMLDYDECYFHATWRQACKKCAASSQSSKALSDEETIGMRWALVACQ